MSRSRAASPALALLLLLGACGEGGDVDGDLTQKDRTEAPLEAGDGDETTAADETSTPGAFDQPADDVTVPETDGDAGTDTEVSPPAASDDQQASNAASHAALEEGERLWAGQTDELYVFSYREEGEGIVSEYCVEGRVGSGASDAAACPFEHEQGGRSVEDWFTQVRLVLDNADDTGRIVEASFDAETGHPRSIVITGGETDGFAFTLIDLAFQDPVVGSDDPNFDACDAGDPDACYRYGRSGGEQPPSFDRGNSYSQAPDNAVETDCRSGDPQACYEAGVRGLDNPRE